MTRRGSLLAAAFALSISAGPAFAAWPYDSIISFGDSLSDVGNLYLATGGAQPASPYFMGRFSNGPIWLDDLAASMHLAPLVPSLAGGTDFAWGGATTGYPDTNNDKVPNIEEQVAQFSVATGGHASSTALYTFSIGANDLFSAIGGVVGGTITQADAESYAEQAAQVAANQAAILQSEGATDLVVFDVPDLSKTPAMLQVAAGLPAPVADAFEAFVQGLSAYFDSELFSDLAKVGNGTNFKVYDLNIFGLIDSTVANPAAYGFTNVTDACYVGPDTGGGSVCASPESYLFWDDVHPTAHAGSIIAAEARAAVAPEPPSWALMAMGFAGFALVGLRGRREAAA